jgi:hypothetical protein
VTTILAATNKQDWIWIFAGGAVLVVVALLFFAGIWRFRERWLKDRGTEESSEPWTLDDLRKLRERGQVTEEEYQKMRQAMIDAYRPRGAPETEVTPTPDNPDRDADGPGF